MCSYIKFKSIGEQIHLNYLGATMLSLTDMVNNYLFTSEVKLNDSLLYIDYVNNEYGYPRTSIDPSIGYKYQGNFIGLLNAIGVDPKLYLFTMYVNGYTNPAEYPGDHLDLILPTKPPIPRS